MTKTATASKTAAAIRTERVALEQQIRLAQESVERLQALKHNLIVECSELGHPNAVRDYIEKMNDCPDCGHSWGSGRAHY